MTTQTARATSALDSSSLVARAQAGDEEAFTMLVELHQHSVYRTAWAIVRNEADALDAAQETFIGAWRELPRLRHIERFDAWLTRSLVNRCRTILRSRRRTSIREIAIADSDGPDGNPLSGVVEGSFEDSDAIRHAFEQLSADHRTYLVLHYVEGRPISEIVLIVGAPAGTVKWRLSRARRALERNLARENR
jgi:RNA polymerase sigma-70 factor (ECF subfamily)